MKLPQEVLKRLANKFRAAFDGVVIGLKTDRSIRFQWLIAFTVILIFIMLDIDLADWLWIIFCAAMVVAVEHLNSAIEELADFVEPKYSEHIKRIKDFSAAAVLIVSIASALIGLLILIKYF